MNRLNRFGMSLAVISALGLGLVGCGSSDSDSTPAQTTTEKTVDTIKTVTVERGKVYDANVTDSSTPNQTATQEEGTNNYTFENAIVYPVKVNGGFIDVDGDGKYSEGDLDLDMELISYEDKVTAISTYISKDEDGLPIPYEADRQAKLDELAKKLDDANATAQDIATLASDLLKLPSEQTTKAQTATNAIYAQMVDKNSTDISLDTVKDTADKLQDIVNSNPNFTDLNSSAMAMALEKAIIADPKMDGGTDNPMSTVTADDVTKKLEELNSSTSMPETNTSDSNLTQDMNITL